MTKALTAPYVSHTEAISGLPTNFPALLSGLSFENAILVSILVSRHPQHTGNAQEILNIYCVNKFHEDAGAVPLFVQKGGLLLPEGEQESGADPGTVSSGRTQSTRDRCHPFPASPNWVRPLLFPVTPKSQLAGRPAARQTTPSQRSTMTSRAAG